ncbi:MAG: hypothetical protein AB7O86_12280 [Porticoccaceae bacterium]
MKLNNTDMIERISARIQAIQEHTTAVHAAVRCVGEAPNSQMVDAHPLITALYYRELHEWRTLFMWALTLTPDEQDRIKAAAHDRFLDNTRATSEWLAMSPPGPWLAADEEQFVAMAREAFAPINLAGATE